MSHEANVAHRPDDNSFTRARKRKLELALVVLIVLFMLFVFSALIVATMTQNQRAIDLAPIVAPTPK